MIKQNVLLDTHFYIDCVWFLKSAQITTPTTMKMRSKFREEVGKLETKQKSHKYA